jgi:universal stress protein A
MPAYRHMLVAIDLTDESQQVIDRAREEASRNGASLSLVHVIKPVEQVYGGFGAIGVPGDFGGQLASLEHEAHKQAQQRLAAVGASLGVPVERTHVLLGNAAAEIRRLAEEQDVDLIILGTHGRHGLGLLLGSTANAVLHGVKVDVLVVRVQVA